MNTLAREIAREARRSAPLKGPPSGPIDRPIPFSPSMVRAILDGRKTQTRRPVDLAKLKGYLPKVVRGDFSPVTAKEGVHRLKMNPYGAVSAILGAQGDLGLRPGEFQFLCPYAGACESYVRNDRWHLHPIEPSRLWVRETWCLHHEDRVVAGYRATDSADQVAQNGELKADGSPRWRPSIHMPRWASRLSLQVTAVRLERLQDISEADARAEGISTSVVDPWPREPINAKLYADARDVFTDLWTLTYGMEAWAANPWVWVVEFRRVA